MLRIQFIVFEDTVEGDIEKESTDDKKCLNHTCTTIVKECRNTVET